jgi:hypothetical protein
LWQYERRQRRFLKFRILHVRGYSKKERKEERRKRKKDLTSVLFFSLGKSGKLRLV